MKRKLWQNGKNKLYYSLLTDIIWQFIEYRYNVPTFEKTSDEIINGIKLKNISLEKVEQLNKIFAIADMVKFAKQTPTQEENIFTIDIIRNFIISERNDLIKDELKLTT